MNFPLCSEELYVAQTDFSHICFTAFFLKIRMRHSDAVAHACNPGTQEMEVGRRRAPSQARKLHRRVNTHPVGGEHLPTCHRVHSPSISTSIWFRVFSCSLWPPRWPRPRFRPIASISSMNKIQGAFFLAIANMSRTCKGNPDPIVIYIPIT